MAISYVQVADWNTVGTSGGTGYYKDLAFTGLNAGDLIVVCGIGQSYFSGTVRSIVTQAGATSAWTTHTPTVTSAADCEYIAGWATVTSGTTATIRVQLRIQNTHKMGACAWVFPAAEWSGTPAFTTVGAGDVDGQVSVVVPATRTVLFATGDWNVKVATTSATPAGSTNHLLQNLAAYTVVAYSWLSQAAGTRNYGPTGITGADVTGAAIMVAPGAAALPLAGIAAATTATTGTVGSRLALAGTLAGIVATSGTINLVGGSQVYPLAGTLTAVTGTVGALQSRLVLGGTVAGTAATSGTAVARHPLTGLAVGAVVTTIGAITGGTGGVTDGQPKVWTGSVWAKKPGKVWNGSAWVEKPWKAWTGSIWKKVT